MGRSTRLLVLCAAVGLCALPLATARPAVAAPGLVVGVDDDTIEWLARPDGVVGVDRRLGVGAIRLTLAWHLGQTRPGPRQQVELHRIAGAVALGMRVVLGVYGRAAEAPATDVQRDRYCGFLEHVLARLPGIRDVVIWNEANSPAFWRPAAPAAPAYEALLARCWDVLHGLDAHVDLLSSTASRHDPAGFLLALGAEYRRSGRTRPLVDVFGHNPYPDYQTESPLAVHPGGTQLDEGDYDALLATLGKAFGGTAQPLPGDGNPTIWYLEDGFQSSIPPELLRLYTGRETTRLLAAPAAGGPQGADQGSQLATALELAYCQPAVGAFFNFELIDEHRLEGWQSGLLWTNGLPKPAFAVFAAAVGAVGAGTVDCAGLAAARP